MQTYPAYKDSGIEWIGEIPEHWETKPLRYILKEGKDGIRIGPFGSSLKYEIIKSEGYKIYGQGNVIRDDFEHGHKYVDEEKFSELKDYEIVEGDIVITMMGTTGKSKIVPPLKERGIMDSHLIRIRPDEKKVLPRLLSVLINDSNYLYHNRKILSKGSIMEGLNSSIIKSLVLVTPPLEEQTAIANFLDHKTAQIDAAIEKHRQLIELLQEHRAAIINEAVTAGVDENGALRQKPRCLPAPNWKDSGIEWIGEIPEHWEVKKLKYFIDEIFGGGTPSTDKKEYWNGDIPWVSPKDMKCTEITKTQDYITELGVKNSSTNLVHSGTILVVFRSGILKHTLPVAINSVEVALNQDMKAIKPKPEILGSYFKHLHIGLQNEILIFCSKVGATVDSIDMHFYSNFVVPFIPSMHEQQQVVDYIESETTRIDEEITLAQTEIDLLEEYRQSLIAEAVTGKIDVRDYPLN